MKYMQNEQPRNNTYRLILKDWKGNVILEQEANLEDFAGLLNDKEILNATDDTVLEYYLIKHPELTIKKDGRVYWHKNYSAGKGLVPTFFFVEE